jgi:uncharacterized sodium:solute symporter family permease YidK
VYFVALLAAVPRGLILHLLPALRAAVVDHFVVVLHRLHEPRDHVEFCLLLCSLAVTVPGGLLQGLVGLDRIDHLSNKLEVVLFLGLVCTVKVSAGCH